MTERLIRLCVCFRLALLLHKHCGMVNFKIFLYRTIFAAFRSRLLPNNNNSIPWEQQGNACLRQQNAPVTLSLKWGKNTAFSPCAQGTTKTKEVDGETTSLRTWKGLGRGNRPPLPSLILCNACSLRNKMDECKVYIRNCFEYRKSSAMVFTETLLHPDISSLLIELDSFPLVCSDRSM